MGKTLTALELSLSAFPLQSRNNLLLRSWLNNIHVAQTDVEAVEIEVVVAAEVVADLVIEGVDEEDHEVVAALEVTEEDSEVDAADLTAAEAEEDLVADSEIGAE